MVYRQSHPRPVAGVGAMRVFDSSDQGIRLNYPASFDSSIISEDARKVGTIFRATQGSAALIAVRRETKLGVLKLAGGSIIDQLKRTVDRNYPSQYSNYEKQSLDNVSIGAEQGVRYEFTYTGTDEKTLMRQQLNILVVRDTDGYMISFQAPNDQFDAHRPEFQAVLDSAKFPEPKADGQPK